MTLSLTQPSVRAPHRGGALLFALTLLLTCAGAQALSIRALSLPELIKQSQLIIQGRVLSQEVVKRDRPSGRPWVYTLSTVEVSECWYSVNKGCPAQVVVSQLGGEINAQREGVPPLRLVIPGLPLLTQGQEVGLFLTAKRGAPPSTPQFVIVGGPQGLKLQSEGRPLSSLQDQVKRLTAPHSSPSAGSSPSDTTQHRP